MKNSPPWWHSPGITLAGKCRLRDGTIVRVFPFGFVDSPALYRMWGGGLTWDIDGNHDSRRELDIVENLENIAVKS